MQVNNTVSRIAVFFVSFALFLISISLLIGSGEVFLLAVLVVLPPLPVIPALLINSRSLRPISFAVDCCVVANSSPC